MEHKIAVFLYCWAINDWKERLENHLLRTKTSGLYDAVDLFQLVITDETENQLSEIDELLQKYPKCKLYYTSRNWYEATALDLLDKFIKESVDEYKIFYYHVKGVYNKYKNFDTLETHPLKNKGIQCWTNLLEYFLVDNWKTCIDLLDTHDTVGVTNNGNWWWGNFWWTKTSYIKKIAGFNDFFGGSRWHAEAWLHEAHPNKEEIKYHEMFKFTYDPYYTVIPSYFYDGTDLTNLKITITKAQYGYFAEQRDEGRGLSTIEDKIADVTDLIKEFVKKDDNKKIAFVANNPHHFSYEQFGDPAFGYQKSLRVWFTTNIDPEIEYTLSTFLNFPTSVGYVN